MGEDNAYLEEAPSHAITVGAFWIDEYTVTDAAFVTAAGYRTVAAVSLVAACLHAIREACRGQPLGLTDGSGGRQTVERNLTLSGRE